MKKTFKILSVILMILLVLQTVALCIFSIQFSDSKLYRLVVGFIGLGLIITPLTLKTLGRVSDDDEKLTDQWLGFVYLVYMLASPWEHIMSHGSGRMLADFGFLAVASSAILLASSSLGFFITGMISVISPPEYQGVGLEPTPVVRGLRLVLSLGLLCFALYNIFPVLSFLSPVFYRINPFSMLPGSFGQLVATTAGNPWVWLVNIAASSYVYFRFYSDWILKQKI